jgi:hypothetical protein
MNPQYFLTSLDLLIQRKGWSDSLKAADCLEGIAKCLRNNADTLPELAAIVFSAIKLARGESSYRLALILERFARDIRLRANQKTSFNQSKGAGEIQKISL